MKLIKIPLNAGALSKKKGIEKGPDVIHSKIENFYLKENGVLPFFSVDEVKIDNLNIEKSNLAISKKIQELDIPAIIIE